MTKKAKHHIHRLITLRPLLITLAFVAIGIALLQLGRAATLVVSAEPELARIEGNAARKDDPLASGRQSVIFGNNSSGNLLYQAACRQQIATSTSGTLTNSNFKEVSGLAASRTTDNTYWAHNDSGDSARIFSLSNTGTHLGTFTISGSTATDWEDIDTGPGPVSGQSYIYIADTGDNDLKRNPVQIYRLPEPNPANGGAVKAISGAEKLNLNYAGGAKHNVEAVFVDPSTGEMYVIDKSDSRKASIFKAPANLAANSTTTMTKVGEIGFADGNGYELITGADMSPAGNSIAIRTYQHLYIYDVPAGTTVASALSGTACVLPTVIEEQGEAVAFKRSSRGLLTVSEGTSQPLHNFDIK